MKFQLYIPSAFLKPYIRQFVVSENDTEQTYKVLPDTSIVLGFQYRGLLLKVKEHAEQKLATAGITGLQDSYQIFKNTHSTATILVYFTETGASHFFKNPLNEIFSESIPLDSFFPTSVIQNIQEQLSEANTDRQRIAIIEKFLVSQFQFAATDKLVAAAIQQIVLSYGTIRIADLAKNLYTSQSPLEKRFRKIVGATPKKFASIIRLKATIDAYKQPNSMTDIGYTAGYFDQAHFIKDFKTFTGETPEQFFKQKHK